MEQLTETQVRNYFDSLNTELGISNHGECAFLCPVHGEEHASASFNLDKGVWFCHPCDLGGDLYKMEMLMFPEDSFPVVKQRVDAICEGVVRTEGVSKLAPKKELKERKWRPFTEDTTYYYQALVDSETGGPPTIRAKYSITKVSYTDEEGGKGFFAWHKTSANGPRIWHFPPNYPKILYRLPELANAKVVFIVEGEKCVERLRKVLPDGCAATTNAFGAAGKWDDCYSQHLAGKQVIILPDNDEPGMKHSEKVAASVSKFADVVKIGHVPLEDKGSDIADLIDNLVGIPTGDFTPEQKHVVMKELLAIMHQSLPWVPKVETSPPVPTETPDPVPTSPATNSVVQVNAVELGDVLPPFPEDCMYGWCGERAKELQVSLGHAYPAMLGVASAVCPNHSDGTRGNLFVANLGLSGSSKSASIQRSRNTVAIEQGVLHVESPHSDRGLYNLLKHGKEEPPEYTKTVLLSLDEMSLMFEKMNIQSSTLNWILNELWGNNAVGGSTKDFGALLNCKLSIVGAIPIGDKYDFKEMFGRNTTKGLIRRFIFGVSGEPFDWMPWHTIPDELPKGKIIEIPTWAHDQRVEWKNSKPSRQQLGEPMLRVAMITSYANGDDVITPEAVDKAIQFMEWQERIREIYMPGASENKDAEVEETILRALSKVGIGGLVRWRDLYRTCHLDRKGVVIANRVRENMKRNGVIGWNENTKHIWRLE